jgi:hypothetical protein
MLIWRRITFPAVTTSGIRVITERAVDSASRIVEVEAWGTDAAANLPPSLTMTAPSNGAVFTAPTTIAVSANASDTDGWVKDVAFYANGMSIGVDATAPYSISWSDVAAGSYTLTAVATDNVGLKTTSNAIHITVAASTPDTRFNVALAANGGTATASSTLSSGYAPTSAINGDRRGLNWGSGGGWKDATGSSYPDWLEIVFNGTKTIDEVAVFSVQDNYKSPAEPIETMTFTKYGLVDFTLQYWTGSAWQAVSNGVVRGNTLVWRRVTFSPVTTSRIRVLTQRGKDGWSRITEVEAYEVPTETAEWFVAPGGTGSGTSTSPFGRIQDALNAAQPGDVVTVRRGTYADALRTVRAGAAGRPIRLRAADGRGSVVVTAAGRVLTVGHAYVTVEGLVLDGRYGADDTLRVTSAADYFTLRNTEVRRSSRDLIDMGGPAGVLIEDALIHHALNAAGGRTDAHGIAAGPVRDLTIRRTEIHTFSGDGFQVDPGRTAPGWTRVTIEGSRIWLAPLPSPANGFAAGVVPGENAIDTKASPSLPRASITIRNTIAYGFRHGLLANMAAFNLKEHVTAIMDRVTVYDSHIAFRLRGPTSSTPAGAWVTLMNAVVYNVATAFRYEDNIEQLRIWNSTLGIGVTRPFLAASSSSAGLDVRNLLSIPPLSPEAWHASNVRVGPAAFVSAAAHNYALAPGAAAIDLGVTISAVKTDRAGVLRPQGARYDAGAYERR